MYISIYIYQATQATKFQMSGHGFSCQTVVLIRGLFPNRLHLTSPAHQSHRSFLLLFTGSNCNFMRCWLGRILRQERQRRTQESLKKGTAQAYSLQTVLAQARGTTSETYKGIQRQECSHTGKEFKTFLCSTGTTASAIAPTGSSRSSPAAWLAS